MKRTISCLLFLVITFPLARAASQEPAGYYVGSSTSLPDSLYEQWQGGRFQIAITRIVHDSLERRLLEHAERLIPPADDIAAAADTVTGPVWARAFAQAAVLPGERWWWREWDGVLLPYALTGATVRHLVERVRTLRDQPNPFAESNPGVEHTASVEYVARVERTGDLRAPYQVQLEVRFRFYCGGRCALYFTHSRTVDFDENGNVVRIGGDGPPWYIVS